MTISRDAARVVAAAVAMMLASAATAQSDRSDRRAGRPAVSSAAQEPTGDSVNPVKRTWDFTKRFGIPKYAGPANCSNDSGDFDKFIADFNGRVNAFLSGPTDAKKLNLERKNYVRQVTGTEREIAAYLSAFEGSGKRGPESYVPSIEEDICRARTQRQLLISIREGLKAMGRVYPDMAEVGPALAQANAALARIGDDKAIQTLVNNNRAATLATVRLKPALAKNPVWEKMLMDGFKRLVPGETVLKLNLYSSSWYVNKHELTGLPMYRQIGAWVATKRSDGSCWINGVDLWQDFDGAGYDSGEYKLGQAPQQILCQNV